MGNVGDRNGHQIWSPVSSTAFGCVVVCATKEFGWIICSRSIYFILGQPLFNVFSCLTQKNIYFLRMGGWPRMKYMDLEQIIHPNSFVAQTTTQPKAVYDTGLQI